MEFNGNYNYKYHVSNGQQFDGYNLDRTTNQYPNPYYMDNTEGFYGYRYPNSNLQDYPYSYNQASDTANFQYDSLPDRNFGFSMQKQGPYDSFSPGSIDSYSQYPEGADTKMQFPSYPSTYSDVNAVHTFPTYNTTNEPMNFGCVPPSGFLPNEPLSSSNPSINPQLNNSKNFNPHHFQNNIPAVQSETSLAFSPEIADMDGHKERNSPHTVDDVMANNGNALYPIGGQQNRELSNGNTRNPRVISYVVHAHLAKVLVNKYGASTFQESDGGDVLVSAPTLERPVLKVPAGEMCRYALQVTRLPCMPTSSGTIIKDLMSIFGPVVRFTYMPNHGACVVAFQDAVSAYYALEGLKNVRILGRRLTVRAAPIIEEDLQLIQQIAEGLADCSNDSDNDKYPAGEDYPSSLNKNSFSEEVVSKTESLQKLEPYDSFEAAAGSIYSESFIHIDDASLDVADWRSKTSDKKDLESENNGNIVNESNKEVKSLLTEKSTLESSNTTNINEISSNISTNCEDKKEMTLNKNKPDNSEKIINSSLDNKDIKEPNINVSENKSIEEDIENKSYLIEKSLTSNISVSENKSIEEDIENKSYLIEKSLTSNISISENKSIEEENISIGSNVLSDTNKEIEKINDNNIEAKIIVNTEINIKDNLTEVTSIGTKNIINSTGNSISTNIYTHTNNKSNKKQSPVSKNISTSDKNSNKPDLSDKSIKEPNHFNTSSATVEKLDEACFNMDKDLNEQSVTEVKPSKILHTKTKSNNKSPNIKKTDSITQGSNKKSAIKIQSTKLKTNTNNKELDSIAEMESLKTTNESNFKDTLLEHSIDTQSITSKRSRSETGIKSSSAKRLKSVIDSTTDKNINENSDLQNDKESNVDDHKSLENSTIYFADNSDGDLKTITNYSDSNTCYSDNSELHTFSFHGHNSYQQKHVKPILYKKKYLTTHLKNSTIDNLNSIYSKSIISNNRLIFADDEFKKDDNFGQIATLSVYDTPPYSATEAKARLDKAYTYIEDFTFEMRKAVELHQLRMRRLKNAEYKITNSNSEATNMIQYSDSEPEISMTGDARTSSELRTQRFSPRASTKLVPILEPEPYIPKHETPKEISQLDEFGTARTSTAPSQNQLLPDDLKDFLNQVLEEKDEIQENEEIKVDIKEVNNTREIPEIPISTENDFHKNVSKKSRFYRTARSAVQDQYSADEITKSPKKYAHLTRLVDLEPEGNNSSDASEEFVYQTEKASKPEDVVRYNPLKICVKQKLLTDHDIAVISSTPYESSYLRRWVDHLRGEQLRCMKPLKDARAARSDAINLRLARTIPKKTTDEYAVALFAKCRTHTALRNAIEHGRLELKAVTVEKAPEINQETIEAIKQRLLLPSEKTLEIETEQIQYSEEDPIKDEIVPNEEVIDEGLNDVVPQQINTLSEDKEIEPAWGALITRAAAVRRGRTKTDDYKSHESSINSSENIPRITNRVIKSDIVDPLFIRVTTRTQNVENSDNLFSRNTANISTLESDKNQENSSGIKDNEYDNSKVEEKQDLLFERKTNRYNDSDRKKNRNSDRYFNLKNISPNTRESRESKEKHRLSSRDMKYNRSFKNGRDKCRDYRDKDLFQRGRKRDEYKNNSKENEYKYYQEQTKESIYTRSKSSESLIIDKRSYNSIKGNIDNIPSVDKHHTTQYSNIDGSKNISSSNRALESNTISNIMGYSDQIDDSSMIRPSHSDSINKTNIIDKQEYHDNQNKGRNRSSRDRILIRRKSSRINRQNRNNLLERNESKTKPILTSRSKLSYNRYTKSQENILNKKSNYLNTYKDIIGNYGHCHESLNNSEHIDDNSSTNILRESKNNSSNMNHNYTKVDSPLKSERVKETNLSREENIQENFDRGLSESPTRVVNEKDYKNINKNMKLSSKDHIYNKSRFYNNKSVQECVELRHNSRYRNHSSKKDHISNSLHSTNYQRSNKLKLEENTINKHNLSNDRDSNREFYDSGKRISDTKSQNPHIYDSTRINSRRQNDTNSIALSNVNSKRCMNKKSHSRDIKYHRNNHINYNRNGYNRSSSTPNSRNSSIKTSDSHKKLDNSISKKEFDNSLSDDKHEEDDILHFCSTSDSVPRRAIQLLQETIYSTDDYTRLAYFGVLNSSSKNRKSSELSRSNNRIKEINNYRSNMSIPNSKKGLNLKTRVTSSKSVYHKSKFLFRKKLTSKDLFISLKRRGNHIDVSRRTNEYNITTDQ